MPQISACIGSIELALASIANWPASCARASHDLRSARLRTVWYLPRSRGVLRASSARAAASACGVPLRLAVFSLLLSPDLFDALPAPLLGMLPPPLWGRAGKRGNSEAPWPCDPPA